MDLLCLFMNDCLWCLLWHRISYRGNISTCHHHLLFRNEARINVIIIYISGWGRTGRRWSGWLCGTILMGFDVFSEMVAPHELLITGWAGEPLLSCVSSQMSLQLITSGESLTTEEPVTDKRSLSCVPAEMGLQVWCLIIHLTAAWNVTVVRSFDFKMGSWWSEFIDLLTVRTGTDRSTCVSSAASWWVCCCCCIGCCGCSWAGSCWRVVCRGDYTASLECFRYRRQVARRRQYWCTMSRGYDHTRGELSVVYFSGSAVSSVWHSWSGRCHISKPWSSGSTSRSVHVPPGRGVCGLEAACVGPFIGGPSVHSIGAV